MNAFQTAGTTTMIDHPHVAGMYLKRDYKDGEPVLVIETTPFDDSETEMNGRDQYILDILADLESLKKKAESRLGRFQRIDIR